MSYIYHGEKFLVDLNAPDIKFAIQVVKNASALADAIQHTLVIESKTKADRSPVTIADFAVQALVGAYFMQQMPGESLVAEETINELNDFYCQQIFEFVPFFSEIESTFKPERIVEWVKIGDANPGRRFWTLDPIDGTKGFLRKEQYAIAFALLEDYHVKIAAIGCPNLKAGINHALDGDGVIAVAIRGGGAWIANLSKVCDENAWQRMRVSDISNIANARVLRSFESGHTNVSQIDDLVERLHIQAVPVKMDSQAKQVLLAAGKGEILLRLLSSGKEDYKEKIWDQAPGSLLVEEAGGRVTDLMGKTLDFSPGRNLLNNSGIFASNGLLHALILRDL